MCRQYCHCSNRPFSYNAGKDTAEKTRINLYMERGVMAHLPQGKPCGSRANRIMSNRDKQNNRGRINLSFDLNDPAETAVFQFLSPYAKSRKATAYVSMLVLTKMSESAQAKLEQGSVGPFATNSLPDLYDIQMPTKNPQPDEKDAAAKTEFDSRHLPDAEEDIMEVLDIFGS